MSFLDELIKSIEEATAETRRRQQPTASTSQEPPRRPVQADAGREANRNAELQRQRAQRQRQEAATIAAEEAEEAEHLAARRLAERRFAEARQAERSAAAARHAVPGTTPAERVRAALRHPDGMRDLIVLRAILDRPQRLTRRR